MISNVFVRYIISNLNSAEESYLVGSTLTSVGVNIYVTALRKKKEKGVWPFWAVYANEELIFKIA
jgi:hypothetical protein